MGCLLGQTAKSARRSLDLLQRCLPGTGKLSLPVPVLEVIEQVVPLIAVRVEGA